MMATLTPARLLRADDRIGRLKPGHRANLVHLTDDLQVTEVWVGGRGSTRSMRRRDGLAQVYAWQ
jgi:N-acetylglucosamine-6-phosphate deacetylase